MPLRTGTTTTGPASARSRRARRRRSTATPRTRPAAKIARALTDGEEVEIGGLKMRVLFTPGHTPGSICFLVGDHLVSGDTLFQGGPGRTPNPASLKQELESITSRLLKLPQSTLVHPGHGDDTTIADAVREYEVFASKAHPADLAGDVTWLG